MTCSRLNAHSENTRLCFNPRNLWKWPYLRKGVLKIIIKGLYLSSFYYKWVNSIANVLRDGREDRHKPKAQGRQRQKLAMQPEAEEHQCLPDNGISKGGFSQQPLDSHSLCHSWISDFHLQNHEPIKSTILGRLMCCDCYSSHIY